MENYTEIDYNYNYEYYYDYNVTTLQRHLRTYDSCLLFDDDTIMYETKAVFEKYEDVDKYFLKHIHLNVSLTPAAWIGIFKYALQIRYTFFEYALSVNYAVFSRKTLCLKCYFFTLKIKRQKLLKQHKSITN